MSSFSHRSLDFVIPGDELEQGRIRLEHNLQDYDPSFSPATSDQYFSDSHSIEQPRRNSTQSSNRFASLDRPSYDHFDPAEPNRIHAWSYRSGDDEDAVNPYGGETVSTAAHHASALTFSAGLGRRGGRRDPSVSGAEFDPERPLQEMIANYRERFSFLEQSKSKSKSMNMTNVEPVVVDDTAEMDRILRAGHSMAQENLSARLRRSSPPSSVTSDSDSPARPKLTEALERVSFSPRRPRTVPARPPQRTVESVAAPAPKAQVPVARKSAPTVQDTPRAQPRRLPSAMATPQAKTRSQPTPPSSKFTKMARGINQDLEMERTMRQAPGKTPESANRKRTVNFDLGRQVTQDPSYLLRSKLHLPDFTGLTSAVESPARVRLQHRAYQGRTAKIEDEFLPSLDALHKKLLSLETENAISRRRVRELEMELRSAQETSFRDKPGPSNHRASVKAGKAAQISRNDDQAEEQQALEELVLTLRGHLTRLTSELSSQRQLLMELREQRDADQAHDRDKSFEIERLKSEVERLAGEVEVLRGVVEDGLRETRAASQRRTKPSEDEDDKPDWSFSQNANDDEPKTIPVVRIASPPPRLTAEEVLARSASFSRASTPPTAPTPLPEQVASPSPSRASTPTSIENGVTQPAVEEEEESDDAQETHDASMPDIPEPEQHPTAPPAQPKRTNRHTSRASRRRSESPTDNPFPKIRGHRMEQMFFSAPEHDSKKCTTCKRRYQPKETPVDVSPWLLQRPRDHGRVADDDEGFVDGETSPPTKRQLPQTTLVKVLRELEDDFSHYKSIYVEMAEQYGYLDAITDIPRRKALARHLHDIIELLEQRGDQIASLYDLLKFEDKAEG